MTAQEAKIQIDSIPSKIWEQLQPCDNKAIGIAIEALEKQIPKKPINAELTIFGGGTQILYANCPICEQPVKIFNGHQNNKEFRRDEDVFCSYCGQHIDWSE